MTILHALRAGGHDEVPPLEYATYNQDGLLSIHNADFLRDARFENAFRRGAEAAGTEYSWHWRFSDFELLISDNASDDGTPEVCSAFARLEPRVRYERLPADIGALQNFERVLLRARGKYFMWAAHDDRRRPSCIRECLDALEGAPEAVLAVNDVETIQRRRARRSLLDTSAGNE